LCLESLAEGEGAETPMFFQELEFGWFGDADAEVEGEEEEADGEGMGQAPAYVFFVQV